MIFMNLLFGDDGKDSKLAAQYLRESGTEFQIKSLLQRNHMIADEYRTNPGFGHFFKYSDVPILWARHNNSVTPWSYPSLTGVKNYLRGIKGEELFGDEFGMVPKRFWNNLDYWRGGSNVVYFGEDEMLEYRGNLENSFTIIKNAIQRHPQRSSDWHLINGWKVGELEKLAKIPLDKGMIVDKKTKTILFPDDIEILRKGKDVVTEDWAFMAEAGYEAYFSERGNVFGIYARVLD